MIAGERLGAFLDALASDAPTPGGGTASALAGAAAAALVAMVCRLSLKRSDDAALRAALEEAERHRRDLLRLADDDAAAFEAVMAARRLPRGNDDEKAARRSAVQASLRRAADVPVETARRALDVVELAETAARGLLSAASDAGVAALLARAAALGAILNVRINLGSIEDAAYRARAGAEADRLERDARAAEERALAAVRARLGA